MSAAWHIIAVFDPDGNGRDFGYTVGLHDHGLPELFLWARPTDGDDPADDWKLSSLDIGHQLNDLASQLIDGSLAPGATVQTTYDDGATHATLRLQPTVPAHGGTLEAFQTSPDATVCEIRWSLQRAPIGPRRELDADETAAARDRLSALIGTEPADRMAFCADAAFGPSTPVFTELRTRVRAMDTNRADHLIAAVHLGFRAEADLASTVAAAREVGLHREATDAIDLAFEDANVITTRAFADDPELRKLTTSLFTSVLAATYGAEIAHHAVPEGARGTSEVVWALLDPEQRWTSRFVAAATRADAALAPVFARADTDALAATVADLDEDAVGRLVGLWPLAAAAGHGSGLWLVIRLVRSIAGLDAAWRAAAALATTGYDALGIVPPPELGPELVALARRVATDVRATALRKAS